MLKAFCGNSCCLANSIVGEIIRRVGLCGMSWLGHAGDERRPRGGVALSCPTRLAGVVPPARLIGPRTLMTWRQKVT